MKNREIISTAVAMAVMFVCGFVAARQYAEKPPILTPNVKTDTLYVRDTIVSNTPVFVTRRVIDSVLVAAVDTVRLHDTTFVYMEREAIEWRDSLSAVYASGVMPQIDSVRHFVTDRYITIETTVPVKVRSRWGVGVNAGYGVGKGGLSPYVGVGVSYNLLSW